MRYTAASRSAVPAIYFDVQMKTTKHTAHSIVVVAATAIFALPSALGAREESDAAPVFSDAEIKIILSHGPWPMSGQPDPSNRASGNATAIEFGTRLFFDQRLSGPGDSSCGSCHIPERHWSDNQRRGIGMTELDRKTPTLANLRG